MFEGVMDTLNFHYKRFEKRHKKASHYFWNPEVSWGNKYDENFQPKFFGSTTFLVFLTDGWHLFKWLKNLALISCIGFAIFYTYEINVYIFCAILYMANRLGFTIIYNWFYK
jgi:hypothetical protein